MSDQRAVTVTYALADPPIKNATPSTPMAHTFSYSVLGSPSLQSAFYASASAAVLQAQRDLNEHLTAWKDAVGDAEKSKEDAGQVGFGRGKAARMMQYAAGRDKADKREAAVEDQEDEDEDGPGDAE
jgi:hypothetical protein